MAGVFLLKRWRAGLWLGVAALLPQTVFLQAGKLSYMLAALPVIEITLWPPISFTLLLGVRVVIQWGGESQPLYLGVNAVAGVLAMLLQEKIDRLALARRRLARSGRR